MLEMAQKFESFRLKILLGPTWSLSWKVSSIVEIEVQALVW